LVSDTSLGNFNSPNGAKAYSLIQSSDGNLIACGENDIGTGRADARVWVVSFPSTVTAIKNPTEEILSLFPNPTTNFTTLIIPSGISKSTRVEVYAADGKLFSSNLIPQGSQEIKIDARKFSPGVYIIRITDFVHAKVYSNRMLISPS